ncbi:nickel ABC transporter permease [Limnochorda pilosa]|uniref:Nickel import system permease protein NikB n=1 Tax=Limnochorda pilosa TaxID=1555112 RepID=A0A0K2SMB6_LIMPI|nr:nickel ABC transporter permease [Limnochorda pilosa]BAS27974.1 glutathione ABC transporter permease [Limnochorda pilosa]
MLRYVSRRLLLAVPVLLGITFIVFAMVTFAPGDAISLMLGSESANPANVERLREELGLDLPWYVQYANYMNRLLHGDLGRSITYGRPVADQIAQRFPNTLLLAVSASLFALIIGLPLGVLAASRRNTVVDYASTTGAMLGVSLPNFWLGLMLLLFFGLRLRWLPIRGIGDLSTGVWSFVSHLILPSITLGAALAALLTRLTRSSVLDVLGEDFIRTSRAKGVPGRLVLFKHALRNALLPVVTTFGMQFGALLGGAVITETIFSWPGMGMLAVNAIKQRDLPVIQGTVLVFALSFMVVTLATDLVYALINPRIRYE